MTLHPHLAACAAQAPEYGAGLSTHLPMTLHALHSLGAGEKRLAAYALDYGRQLQGLAEPPLAPAPLSSEQQAALLGQWPAWPQWLAHHRHRVRALGLEGAVAEALPQLMPGVAAAAFHGLLRTAHGLAAGHAGEVAQGLAYWAARHLPLGLPRTDTPAALPLARWWAALDEFAHGRPSAGTMISGRMQHWAAQPGFATVAGSLALEGSTLPELARQAAAAYAEQGDFTVLHVLTSSWALHQLQPLQANEPLALRHYTVAVAAGWLARGRGRPVPALPLPGWPELRQVAQAARDDHTAKLIYAAWRWHQATGHEEFQRAAARAAAGNLRA